MAFIHSSAGVYVIEIDNSIRVNAASTSIAAIVGESDRGPVEVPMFVTNNQEFVDLFGVPNPKKSFMHYAALAFLEQGNRLYVTRVNDGADCSGMVLYCRDISGGLWTNWAFETKPFSDPAVSLPAGVALTNPIVQYSFADPEELLMFSSIDPGTWGNDITVEVKDVTTRDTSEFVVNVYYGESTVPSESFTVTLHENIDGYGLQSQVEHVINRRSKYIRVKVNQNHFLFLNPPTDKIIINYVLAPQSLDFGQNGSFPNYNAKKSAIIGGVLPNEDKSGWEIYSDAETINVNILINGGYSDPDIQRRMDEIARNRMDAFAILDMPHDYQAAASTLMSEVDYRRNILNLNSSYSGIYTPDLYIQDSYNNIALYVPPSGHMAGVFAKTDRVGGPWFEPAGINRGTLKVLGVFAVYDQTDRDVFSEHQINPVRSMRGYGTVVWGADTMQTYKSALSNIGVRRLMAFLEKSIAEACLVSVFDPNSPRLRRYLTSLAESFLEPIKIAGGMYWYGVVCDDYNNSVATTTNGDLILDVYIDPNIAAKRIHLNAIMAKSGAVSYAVNLVSMTGASAV